MLSKPKITIFISSLLFLILVLICLLAGIYFYLPKYLESKIIPKLAVDAGLPNLALNVRNIGFFKADFGTLRIGPEQNPALVIQSLRVDYSPQGLFRKKIDKISLSGIELYAVIANGQFKLRGVDVAKLVAGAQPQIESAPAVKDTTTFVSVQKLTIRNSRINIAYNGQNYRLPFELEVVPRDPELRLLDGVAVLYPRGTKITATVNLNRSQRKAALKIESENLDFGRFADISSRAADMMASGELSLQGKANIQWAPLRFSSVTASLVLRRTKINTGVFKFQNALDSGGQEIPFQIDLIQKKEDEWQVSGGRIAMEAPAALSLSGFDATVVSRNETLAGSGNFTAALHPSTESGSSPLPLKIEDSVQLQGQFEVQFLQNGSWQCEISDRQNEAATGQKIRLSAAPYNIISALPKFNLSAKKASQTIDTALMLKIPEVRIDSDSESIQIPQLEFKGAGQIATGADITAAVSYNLRAPKTGITFKGGKINISDLSVSGKLNRNIDRLITLDSVMNIAGAGGLLSDLNVRFSGARGKIPFKWPATGKSSRGSFSIANLKFNGMKLGSLTGHMRQTTTGYIFDGRHRSILLPSMRLAFKGESRVFHSGPASTSVHLDLSHPDGAPDIELEKFFPEAAGARLNGKLQLDGDLIFNAAGFKGLVKADFTDGKLLLEKDKLALEGIRLSLDFPELPVIRSAPGQQVHFTKFALHDIVAENGEIDFQIESARSFLIEKMRFKWCEGKVETQSIRLTSGVEDYRITLYCDRLNLAKVLEQFGAADAKGQGTVSGRIPLHYADAKIRFDDGFLFSTPGEGGKIYLSGTDILTAGIPPNTPQFVQMELAAAALKDYDYSWAKLNITSEGEELLLQMQMDGKPARTLPFVYRKDIGGFVKLEAGSKGSKFQGIRLDVNFRLPLNKLLQYKDLIEMIE